MRYLTLKSYGGAGMTNQGNRGEDRSVETMATGVEQNFTDRERILINIASALAHEVSHLQSLPEVRRYLDNQHSLSRVRCDWSAFNDREFKKGDLVACFTSHPRQQNPWLIAFVEDKHPTDASGLVLRAIGSQDTCNYGNESFIRISGIAERLLWEGGKHAFSRKLNKAIAILDSYVHRFRGLEFREEGIASVFIGQVWGGLDKKTKPYELRIKFSKRTSVKNIIAQMQEQGFGTREFEPDDGSYTGPMQGLSCIKRDDLVGTLEAQGIKLKPEFK